MARSVGHSKRTCREDRSREVDHLRNLALIYTQTKTRYYISRLLSHSVHSWCLGLTLMKKDPLLWRLNTLGASSSFDLPVGGSFILQRDAIPQRLHGTTVWQRKAHQEQHCPHGGLASTRPLKMAWKDSLVWTSIDKNTIVPQHTLSFRHNLYRESKRILLLFMHCLVCLNYPDSIFLHGLDNFNNAAKCQWGKVMQWHNL